MADRQTEVFGVMSDLLFTVKIMEAAKKLGAKACFLKDQPTALSRMKDQPALVIFDLNYDAADPLGTIRKMKTDPVLHDIPTIGYVSHVQVELRNRAEASGCDVVIPRSAFVQRLPELLQRYLPQAK